MEVFEDAAPLATRRLLNRCREGSSEALQGTCVHRLVPDQGLFFGTSRGFAALQRSGVPLPCCAEQRAVARNALHFHAGVSLMRQAELSWQMNHKCAQNARPGCLRSLAVPSSAQ